MDELRSVGARRTVNNNAPFIEPGSVDQFAAFTGRRSRATSAADFDHATAPMMPPPPSPRGSLQPESIGARVTAQQQQQQQMVKVGETISADQHDTREVLPEDMSPVHATIHCILSLERLTTVVVCRVKRYEGYYSLIFPEYNEYIDIDNFHRAVRATLNPKMLAMQQCQISPRTGSLLVRVGMQGVAPPAIDGVGGSDVSNRKRNRSSSSDALPVAAAVQHVPENRRFVNMREVLSNHYDCSEVHTEDVNSVLATLNSLLCLENGMPVLPCRITRRMGFYTLSMTGFTELIDLDKLHALIRLDPDPETLHGVTKSPLVEWVGANPKAISIVARVVMKSTVRGVDQQQQQSLPLQYIGPSVSKRGRAAGADERY